MKELKKHDFEFVVIGGGAVGCGVADSPVRAGKTDLLLVESLFDDTPSDYVKSLNPDRFAEASWNWAEASVQARRIYETNYGIECC